MISELEIDNRQSEMMESYNDHQLRNLYQLWFSAMVLSSKAVEDPSDGFERPIDFRVNFICRILRIQQSCLTPTTYLSPYLYWSPILSQINSVHDCLAFSTSCSMTKIGSNDDIIANSITAAF
nr:hypothetical protein HmN_000107800 [Hymenolepis microstoma]